MSRGTASCGIVFPDGKQRNNARKMRCLLFPADEVRAGLVCTQLGWKPAPLLILTHPSSCFKVTPRAGGLSPRGLWMGVRVLHPRRRWGESEGAFCFGWADLAVPAVQNTRAPAPLPAAVSSRPCADSTAHQLAAIYLFFTPRLLSASPKISSRGLAAPALPLFCRHLPKMPALTCVPANPACTPRNIPPSPSLG